MTGQVQGNTTTSSISAFIAGPSASCKHNFIADNQRSDIDNFVGIASIADRAKTRQRNLKSNLTTSSDGQFEKQKSGENISSDIIELTSEDNDDELSPPSSQPKSRPRPKPKFKVKDKPSDMCNDTLCVSGTTEINTDKSVDAFLDPPPRPRPRPRPLVKRNNFAQESTVPPPLHIPGVLPSSSASAFNGPELPIATSPIRSHHTSQLPPSDPPLPTLTTIHDQDDLPRIETLPNLDFDGPLSSPSSLFSDLGDLGDSMKKRKRTIFDQDIDELTSDSELGSRQGGIEGGAPHDYNNHAAGQLPSHMLPPPPTFFAGSSSSSIGRGGRIPQVPSELAHDPIDLTTLPPTIEPTSAAAKNKASKAKTPRRKKGDVIPMDEDELDDDFDPTESAHKGKSKPKPKAKKGADSRGKGGTRRAQIEVSIVSKPRKQKTKGKGKEKATDTFKSREFVDESGDEEDPIQLIPGAKNPATIDTSHSISTHISTATGKTAEISAIASVGGTSTLETQLEENTPDDKFESGKPSSPRNRMNKKRKSIIESDLEDEDEGEKDQQTAGTSSKKHKGRQGKNGENVDEETLGTIVIKLPAATKKVKKGKNVVRSDEDGEDSAIDADDSSMGLSKGKKPPSRVEDEERSTKKQKTKGKGSQAKAKDAIEDASKDDNDAHMDHENIQQLAPEEEVAKVSG